MLFTPTRRNGFFDVYMYMYIKQFFVVVEMFFFLTIHHSGWLDQNFCLVETVFYYSFSFFLWKPLLALKSVSTSCNEGFFWNIVSTGRKKTHYWQESLKNREKYGSTGQKISCQLARISSFFENCFPPNSNNGFHKQENSSDQKALFPLDRKCVSTSRMKNLLKIAFPLYGKVA